MGEALMMNRKIKRLKLSGIDKLKDREKRNLDGKNIHFNWNNAFSDNNIETEGAIAICEALLINDSLTCLDLGGNGDFQRKKYMVG